MTQEVLKMALEAFQYDDLPLNQQNVDAWDEVRSKAITALREALAQPQQEPVQGWKLVPVEPTVEMLDAADDGDDSYTLRSFGPGVNRVMQGPEDHYAAMLAAAPQPPQHAQPQPAQQHPAKLWCDTCNGTGEVYQEHQIGCIVGGHFECPDCDGKGHVLSRLYCTTPPNRKPLTDDEIYYMYNEPHSDAEMLEFARAIEAAHGIKE